MTRIEGQEEYVYVWTLGVEGLGDGSDKLVTVDVNPKSASYGKVIHSHSVGGRHEAHHGGFTEPGPASYSPGIQFVPASGSFAIAAASIVSATRSSRSRW